MALPLCCYQGLYCKLVDMLSRIFTPKEKSMSPKIVFALLGLLTAFNIVALSVQASSPSRSAVAGMTYDQLVKDQDFSRAVKSVVQSCDVNVDLGKLKC
jgi:hypothetical protein